MRKQKAETALVAKALTQLRARGGFWWRANSGGGKSGHRCNSVNLPDICGHMRFGTAGFVEVKTRDGRLSHEQLHFLRDRMKAGAFSQVFVENEFYELNAIPDKNMPRLKRTKK